MRLHPDLPNPACCNTAFVPDRLCPRCRAAYSRRFGGGTRNQSPGRNLTLSNFNCNSASTRRETTMLFNPTLDDLLYGDGGSYTRPTPEILTNGVCDGDGLLPQVLDFREIVNQDREQARKRRNGGGCGCGHGATRNAERVSPDPIMPSIDWADRVAEMDRGRR